MICYLLLTLSVKTLQAKDIQIDIAFDQLKGLLAFLKKFRENGFATTLISAKEITIQMNKEPVFVKKESFIERNDFIKVIMMR